MIMDSPNTAHNNPEFQISAQIESTDASINDEILSQTGSTPQQRPSCIACSDEIELEPFTAPCKHSYCGDCLASFVKVALEPAGTFPPACCNLPIPLHLAQAHLHHDLIKRWQEKHSEIIASCSLICAKPGCRVVIPPEKIVDGVGLCLACNNFTCRRCRMQAHKDEPCPEDAELKDVMNLAKKEGWQICYQCNNMVELNFGCNHMTCICKAQFCYLCGKKWKNCKCPQFNDNFGGGLDNNAGGFAGRAAAGNVPRYRLRTVFRAERAVQRYNDFLWQTWGRRDPRSHEEQIREVRHEVENGCDHGYWLRVQTTKQEPGHCKLCKYVGRKYILQCLFCPLTSCWNCHTDEPPEYRRVEEDEQQA